MAETNNTPAARADVAQANFDSAVDQADSFPGGLIEALNHASENCDDTALDNGWGHGGACEVGTVFSALIEAAYPGLDWFANY